MSVELIGRDSRDERLVWAFHLVCAKRRPRLRQADEISWVRERVTTRRLVGVGRIDLDQHRVIRRNRTGGKQRGVNAMDCLPLIEAAADLNFMVQCTILTD